jgi:hypothetical protein
MVIDRTWSLTGHWDMVIDRTLEHGHRQDMGVLPMTMSCLWPCSSVLAMIISQCCSVLSMIMSQCPSVQCKTLSQYPHIQVNILFNEHWDNSNMQEAPTFTRYKITFDMVIDRKLEHSHTQEHCNTVTWSYWDTETWSYTGHWTWS